MSRQEIKEQYRKNTAIESSPIATLIIATWKILLRQKEYVEERNFVATR